MSALGHKRTSRGVRTMSALPPIADIRYGDQWNSANKSPLSHREEQREENADVTDIVGGNIENKEEGLKRTKPRRGVTFSPPPRHSLSYGGRADDAAADSCQIMLGGRHADNRSRRR